MLLREFVDWGYPELNHSCKQPLWQDGNYEKHPLDKGCYFGPSLDVSRSIKR